MSANDRNAAASNRSREPLFVGGVFLGVLVLALGVAFLILGVSMDTTPPAPYFASTTDRLLVVAGSLGAVVFGALVVRGSARLAGW